MKALFSTGIGVPLARALHEHRAWLVPLAIVLIVNVVVLIAVVMPLSSSVAANEQRELATQQNLAAAEQDLKNAEALRDGKAQATTDLEAFYKEVLPQDVSAARRLTHIRLAQMAKEHDVLYEQGSTSLQVVKDSSLSRLHVTMQLTGAYADVRSFLHALETSKDFVVIDNMNLSQGGEQGRASALSLSLVVSTYYPGVASADAR